MMKRILLGIAILSIFCCLSNKSFAAELKIGYVDFFQVFNECDKTKEYDAILENKKAVEEKKLDVKKEEIEKMQNKLSLLKDKEQEKEKEKFTKQVKDYREMERKILIDLKKDRDEKMKEIVEDISKVIEDYAGKNNFDFIIHKSAILFGDKAVDLTDPILKLVNEKYKKSAVPAK